MVAKTITVGSWVATVGAGEDADYGRVVSLSGDVCTVAWYGSEVQTPADVDSLTACDSRATAEEVAS